MKNKYLSSQYFIRNIILVLVLSLLAGFLYSNGYLSKLTSASNETINVTYNITSNNDIMNQDGSRITRGSREMWVGTGNNRTRSYLGLRFTGKKFPLDATITAAEITFTSPQDQTVTVSTKAYIENNTLAASFSPNNTPSQRNFLNISKSRKDSVPWGKDETYSYDITDLVKEAYKTNGINGSIAIIFKGTDLTKIQKKVYGAPETLKSPRLRIQYQLPNYTASKNNSSRGKTNQK